MAVEHLYRGAEYRRRLTVTVTGSAVAPVWATTKANFVLDGPGASRTVFEWRPAGTSSDKIVHNAGANTLDLVLPSAWTATNLSTGQYQLGLFFLEPTTTQIPIGVVIINVTDLRSGAAPVAA